MLHAADDAADENVAKTVLQISTAGLWETKMTEWTVSLKDEHGHVLDHAVGLPVLPAPICFVSARVYVFSGFKVDGLEAARSLCMALLD